MVRLADYRPYPLALDGVHLLFTLDATRTLVDCTIDYHANDGRLQKKTWLDGLNLELLSVAVDGKILDKKSYEKNDKGLWLFNLPPRGKITTRVAINPRDNRTLAGLYVANDIFTTQCEAEGFRRITFYPDRPDVMSIFTVEILSDQPVLLSNGNLVESGKRGAQNYAKWHDPFKKPCYLFALVAGDLVDETGEFVTMSGRKVTLKIWSEKQYAGRTGFALSALQRAMKWDETRFGLEYDLDIFQIVGISDFNFGAMENKSLNIFNARYLLLDKNINSDREYLGVDSIIAHEYFHNWSGDRVTLRDWFQLSLKEGLTVFRDQEYSMDNFDRASERLKQVQGLRGDQFAEDASGLSHPVRPTTYKEIDNFYTGTVYEKGAEVIRMLHLILGEEKFQRGIKHYIKQNDGRAATIEDFIESFEAANDMTLDWFMPWYSTKGTPMVAVAQRHAGKDLILDFSQSNNKAKNTLPIPLKIALFDKNGAAIKLISQHKHWHADTAVFLLQAKKDKLVFSDVPAGAVVSLNRGFSAPINLDFAQSAADLAVLLRHDDDGFNRWEAGQVLATRAILADYYQQNSDEFSSYRDGFAQLLTDQHTAPLSLAENFSLPALDELLLAVANQNKKTGADPIKLLQAVRRVRGQLASDQEEKIHARYDATKNVGAVDGRNLVPDDIGGRAINNAMLQFIVNSLQNNKSGDKKNVARVKEILSNHYFKNDNITLKKAALSLINRFSELTGDEELRDAMLSDYFDKIKKDELLFGDYIRLLSGYDAPHTLGVIEQIVATKKIFNPSGTESIDFRLDKPNELYPLLGGLAGNIPQFFRADGKGYEVFLAVVKMVDGINHHTAARLVNMFNSLPQLSAPYKSTMKKHLQKLLKQKISVQLTEMVERTLQG